MATRTELLMLRKQIDQAREGRQLLSDKRSQLLDAFRDVAEEVLADSDALSHAAAESQRTLAMAEGFHGPEEVGSAALAAGGEINLVARPRAVMGVRYADIHYAVVERSRTRRGYSLSASSAHVDAVADSFESQLQLVVRMAAKELRLRRLAEELRKVSRRVNALEHVVIPQLERQQRRAMETLEEREREDLFRLVRVKDKKRARARLS
jgi:V/A-type H+-transporting ATPase subunit D